MIKFVTGDILKSKAEAIAHGVAPNDDFKQGLALSLRENWPSLYKDFRHFSHGSHPKEGTLWTWKGAEGPYIVSLFTQEHAPGQGSRPGKATLPHVNHSLRELVKEAKEKGFKSIAIPKIATGVGGLTWNEVKPLVQEHLAGLGIPVYVYEEYKKDVVAAE